MPQLSGLYRDCSDSDGETTISTDSAVVGVASDRQQCGHHAVCGNLQRQQPQLFRLRFGSRRQSDSELCLERWGGTGWKWLKPRSWYDIGLAL